MTTTTTTMNLWIFGAIFAVVARADTTTNEPIIGILSTPIQDSGDCVTVSKENRVSSEGSCFHSLYVQWIEGAGGRVVPIPYDTPSAELVHLFHSVNGILFTGGDTDIKTPNTTYINTANHLFNLTKAAFASGEHVPLWGTCMGIQTISVLQGGPEVLESGVFDSDPLMLPLENLSNVEDSRMLSGVQHLNPNVLDWVASENITVNLHHDGIFPKTFRTNKHLAEFFNVVSTNRDRNGIPFVSTIEGKEVPIYGVQWHPERPQFEFRNDPAHRTIPHTARAVVSMSTFASFFIDEARKNGHRFEDPEEMNARLIYNYVPHGAEGDSYRAYVFSPSSPSAIRSHME